MLSVRTLGYKSELRVGELMEPGKETFELNRILHAPIEPYNTGFLKVSDLHTVYYEQSGNPSGHVSGHAPFLQFFVLFYFCIWFNMRFDRG